uniref:FAD/NAD(P)-binding domain-containing protein n=1 Tax=Ditylenchus dipsaci TaxID=166011 RepID=A0A915EM49_9BILA
MNKLPSLVILGTGWSSYSLLRSVKTSLYRVIVISPRNHFLFTPLLASTTVGTLEFRSIIEPIRNFVFEHANDLHLSSATSVDFAKQTVMCQSSLSPDIQYPVEYDKLVIGVGALPSTFGVPGVHEHCFFLKEITDARAIRSRLLDNFEKSLEPSISETERSRLKHVDDLARLYKDFGAPVKVTLIESRKILGSFDQRLQAYAEKKLRQRENFTMVKAFVTEVKQDCVILNDGTSISCGLVVWSTGQILTNNCLNIISDPSKNSFAIGDCGDIIDMPLPFTAQVAEREGRYLAERLNCLAKGKEVKPFQFKSMGCWLYIGGYEGLSDLPDFKLKGFPSWFLWRSAYLTRLAAGA